MGAHILVIVVSSVALLLSAGSAAVEFNDKKAALFVLLAMLSVIALVCGIVSTSSYKDLRQTTNSQICHLKGGTYKNDVCFKGTVVK